MPAAKKAATNTRGKKTDVSSPGLKQFFGAKQPAEEKPEEKDQTEQKEEAEAPGNLTGLKKLFATQARGAPPPQESTPAKVRKTEVAQQEASSELMKSPGAHATAKATTSPKAQAATASPTKPTAKATTSPKAQAATASPTKPVTKAFPAPGGSASATETAASPTKPALSAEQVARIEENKRRARERQQAKRGREEEVPGKEDKPSKADEATKKAVDTPSPARPASARAAAEQVTPEKVVLPSERRQPLTPASAPGGAAGQRNGCSSGRFGLLDTEAWMQYNNLYCLRLQHLRKAVFDEARGLWGGFLSPECFVPEISSYRQVGGEVVVVGVLFKELKTRVNVIEQYKDSKVLGNLGERSEAEATQRLVSADDVLWLEDSSMRLRLVTSQEQIASLATGMVVGVRGLPTDTGNFKVSAVCFPRMGSPPPLPSSTAGSTSGPFLALTSGLAFCAGSSAELAASRARAVDFLMGRSEQLPAQAVKRLIVCGGTFTPGRSVDASGEQQVTTGAAAKATFKEADVMLAELSSAMHVEVMPGRGDPTNMSLPQMPLNPLLFKKVRECRDFKSVSNPYECSLDGLSVLGHSGQPVEDLLRCTDISSPVDALAACLCASHLAPTAPDTLPTQPFTDSDPFILQTVPHVLFSGGHERESHQWHPSPRGPGGTLCVCVPAFWQQPAVVLVSLRDPRDVQVHEFSVAGGEGAMDESSTVAA